MDFVKGEKAKEQPRDLKKNKTEPDFLGVACEKSSQYRNTSGSGAILHSASAKKHRGGVVDWLAVPDTICEIITGNPSLMVS